MLNLGIGKLTFLSNLVCWNTFLYYLFFLIYKKLNFPKKLIKFLFSLTFIVNAIIKKQNMHKVTKNHVGNVSKSYFRSSSNRITLNNRS